MKKLTIIAVLFCIAFSSYGQKDIPTLEAIIAAHKAKQDRLNKRNALSASNSALALQIKELQNGYEKVEREISKRIKFGYNTIEFAFEVSNILQEISKTPGLLQDYYQTAIDNKLKNPLILRHYYASVNNIKTEIETCSKIIGAGAIISGNFKEKYDVIVSIKNSVQNINNYLNTAIFITRGITSLNMRFDESFYEWIKQNEIDRKRKSNALADKIIREYSK